ncbi:MAG TPA: hypothetical protein VJL29_00615 [Thermoguttaceae bacterium]|nr:hypothetical protein [Thermoguttaceae bacterium]
MRKTIPDNLPPELVAACRLLIEMRRNMTSIFGGLRRAIPGQVARIDRIADEFEALIKESQLADGLTVGELLDGVELQAEAREA